MVKFNEEQQHVINLDKGWHACQAPAGSGKTEVLAERVRQALRSGSDPKEMLCITFTNRSACEMSERISKLLGDRADGVFIGNTHAYSLKFLQTNRCLPKSSALIETTTESALWRYATQLVVDHLHDLTDQATQAELKPYLDRVNSLIEPPQHVTSMDVSLAFSAIKKSTWEAWNILGIAHLLKFLIDPRMPAQTGMLHEYTKERLMVIDPNIPDEKLALVCALSIMIQEQYEKDKEILSLYDFDDLLLLAYRELISGKSHKMTNFSWAQIDEAQDISPIQWLILKATLASNSHVLILGDIGQSIYRFLGASVEVAQTEFGASIHTLTKNYRSASNLVEAGNIFRSVFFKDSFQSVATHTENPNAMILVNRDYERDVRSVLIRHAVNLLRKYNEVSVAFLCPSNAGVSKISKYLSDEGEEHFKVGNNDLFTKVEALDFMAFLSVLCDSKNRLAWSRVFYCFGDLSRLSSSDRENYSPLLASAHLAAKIGHLGGELKDFLYDDVDNHFLAKFVADAKGAVTYFDTETTGLSTNKDSIIQLAGVKVEKGFSKENIDLYCHTDTPLGDSVEIHKITEEVLKERGESIDLQLSRFMDFNAGCPLIAHNLPFDDRMIRSHLRRFLPQSYAAYDALPKYCTLDLARRFYPELSSHKLGWLLEYFNLDGVNSHNALDDVKGGAALMTKLLETSESRLPDIARIIEPYEDSLQRFSKRFTPLYDQAISMMKEEKVVTIKDLLDLYFMYTAEFTSIEYDKNEFSRKIIRHAEEFFKPAPVHEYINEVVPFYQTAKESDLITDSDRLVVSTIHRSKGLEFDCVLIPYAVEGVLPSFHVTKNLENTLLAHRQEASRLLDEQGRLFYVAFTRAKLQVVVGSYNLHGRYRKHLSRFMEPIKQFFNNY